MRPIGVVVARLYDLGMRILITGATGQLGPYLVRRLVREGDAKSLAESLSLWARGEHDAVDGLAVERVDLTDDDAVRRAFVKARPSVVVHCAAVSSIDGCYRDEAAARAVNVAATARLATLTGEAGARMVYCSTDLVFDGEAGPYDELCAARPTSAYGRTKLAGEAPVLALPGGVVLRLPLLFGPVLRGRPRFVDGMVERLRGGETVTLFDDEWRTPLAVDLAAEALGRAATGEMAGLFHVGGTERLTRWEMGKVVCDVLGADASLLRKASRLSIDSPEPRPRDTSLDSSKWLRATPDFPRESFAESVRRLWGIG